MAKDFPSLYDQNFEMKDIHGNTVKLSDFKGKTVMIVNTASHCGFTPQYAQLESMYQKFKDRGFVVLAFPAGNFMNQEFETDPEILKFVNEKYGVTFPLFSKISVKGSDIHPLFDFLTTAARGGTKKAVKWNFTKFLMDKDGKLIKRWEPRNEPDSFIDEVEKVL